MNLFSWVTAVASATRVGFLAAWALVAACFLALEIRSALSGGRHAGGLSFLRAVTRSNVAFVVVFLGWMWLGWHTFAR